MVLEHKQCSKESVPEQRGQHQEQCGQPCAQSCAQPGAQPFGRHPPTCYNSMEESCSESARVLLFSTEEGEVVMSTPPLLTFGEVLRRYRLAAGLSQEELAERARLSREAISALERGNRRAPRRETLDLLAEALALTEPERATFDVAARQHRMVNPQVSTRMPSGAPPDEPIASSGALSPAEDGPLPSSSLSLVQVVKRLPPPRPFLLPGNRVLALVSGLVVLAMLGGVLFLAVIPGVTGTGPHPGTLCLASDFPTSGPQDRIGQPAENAVQLAVMQNHDLGNGYTLKLIPYNDASASGDQADPERGA